MKPASHTFYVAVSVHTDEGGDVVGFDQEWGGSYSDSITDDGDQVARRGGIIDVPQNRPALISDRHIVNRQR